MLPVHPILNLSEENKCSKNQVIHEDTFRVPPVDGEVEPHQLGELGVTVAQHVGEVVGPVQVGVDGADAAAFTIKVAVDLSSDARQLGNQVHRVFIDKLRKATEKVELHIYPKKDWRDTL